MLALFYLLFEVRALLSPLNQEENLLDDSTNIPKLSPSPTLPPNPSTKKGLSATWLIIIVVSVVVIGSVLITILVFWIIKKAKTKYGHDLEENLMGDNVNAYHQNS